jgi:septum site-determining protein MinC
MIRYRLQFSKQKKPREPFHPGRNAIQCPNDTVEDAGEAAEVVVMTAPMPASANPPAQSTAGGSSPAAPGPAVALKGRMMMVSVMRIATADRGLLDDALASRFAEAPELLRDMPMVLDLESLALSSLADALVVIEHVRRHGFKVIGLRRAPDLSPELVEASGLPEIVVDSGPAGRSAIGAQASSEVDAAGAVPASREAAGSRTGANVAEPKAESKAESKVESKVESETEPKAESKAESKAEVLHSATRLVIDHVRSGQQIYAREGDLIIMGTVSAGAEVLADGHIMIHGTLRGRALAGVRGMTEATIYCRRLDAELLAIAGNYRIAEDIQDAERGENRLVTLQGERLHVRET